MILTTQRAATLRAALVALTSDLVAAGHIQPQAGLRLGDADLFTHDASGTSVDLTPAAQTFVTNWTPPTPPPTPDYGSDGTTQDQVADAVANIRAYINAASPTNAQTVAYVKLLGRVVLFLAQRLLR